MGDFLEDWQLLHERVIVLAGVFDPVHKGHIDILQKAVAAFGGHGVLMPERVPQHKHASTPYEHRLAMLRIAVKDAQNLSVLDYPEDHHMVVEVFEWLGSQFSGKQIGWLIGVDVAGQIAEWPGLERLADLHVDKLIIARRGDRRYIGQHPALPPGVRVDHIKSKYYNMSSSFIRKDLVRRHTSLPPGVYDYIKQNKLYIS